MIDIDFKFYLSLFWRRFPLFLLVWLSISAAAVTVAYILPPMYRASATILVTPPPTTTITTTLVGDPATRIEALRKRLMTRPNLLDIAARNGIFLDRPDMSPSAQIEEMRAATSFNLVTLGDPTLLRYTRTPNAISFTVSYASGNPEIAARVAEEFSSKILDDNKTTRVDIARDAVIFHDNNAKQLETDLADLERQIVLFKTENSDALPGMRPVLMQQVATLENRLAALELQIEDTTDQRNQVLAAIENPALVGQTGQPLSPEEQQLKALQGQLAVKIATFSERHPEIIKLRAEIEVLEDIIQGQVAEGGVSADGTRSQLQITLDQFNKDLERMRAEEEDLKTEIADKNVSIARTPDVEMQFSTLDRRRASLLGQYDTAVAARNAAQRGETVEATQQGEKFELIQRPAVPEFPESPNRLLIAAGGIFVGAVAGLGLLVLLELLNTSVRRPVELVKGLGIQPFATIPYIETRAEILRARLRLAGGLTVILVGVPAILYLVHYQYMPLDLLMTNMLERFGLAGLTATLS